ncbi:MAG: DUF3097 domain-containing protein [Actinomycetaceae bacterium]|nr:DUF3097 domain-containing protein [Actinomycetaceae bacterium]
MATMDRYGKDVLSQNPHREGPFARMQKSTPVPATPGLVVEDPTSGFVGAVLGVEKGPAGWVVVLEDRRRNRRTFPLGPGWWVDGKPVTLTMPAASASPRKDPTGLGPGRTASGSRAVKLERARVARHSRIWVEGSHDAELVEKVWGDDLRYEGVVVEYLDGVDHLLDLLEVFGPTPQRRVGVLVDHAVDKSKETRIAQEAMRRWPDSVLVIGHPYLDVWQAIKPAAVGLEKWPPFPRGTNPKVESLRALGLPHETKEDIGLGWKAILARVRSFRDLEPALLGRVEQLIDFVTASGTH